MDSKTGIIISEDNLGTLEDRATCAFIDFLIILEINALVIALYNKHITFVSGVNIFYFWIVIVIMFFIAYHVTFFQKFRATPGMMAEGLIVVSVDKDNLVTSEKPYFQCFASFYNIFYILSVRKRKKTHPSVTDKILKSRFIYTRKKLSSNSAELRTRIMAKIFDYLLVFLFSVFSFFLLLENEASIAKYRWFFPIYFLSLYLLYNVFLMFLFGRTFGKMAAKMRIVIGDSYERISFFGALCRTIIEIINIILFVALFLWLAGKVKAVDKKEIQIFLNLAIFTNVLFLEMLIIAIDIRHRAIHDWICGTCVVRSR